MNRTISIARRDLRKYPDALRLWLALARWGLPVWLVISASAARAETDRPPNVVLILADDLGYRELGCFGQRLIKTPNLDRLASEGLRLTQHYAGSAVCAPSRCVLMTGKHPGHAAIRNNQEVKPEGQAPLPREEQTLAEVLHAAGYATGAFGKWGLGAPASVGDPRHQGFDRFFGYNCQRHAHSYYPDYLWSDFERVPLNNHPAIPGHARFDEGVDSSNPSNYAQFQGTEYAPDRIHQEALAFVRENADRPFLLYYPTVIPHLALHVPDESVEPYRQLGWPDPPFTKQEGGGYTPHFTPRAAYAGMISRLDDYVGRLLQLLEELELEENTIVIFTSDNGTTHLKREVDHEFFQSVGELRGLKGSLYEGGIRVPTIVRWPGNVAAGSSSEFVSGFEDWLPTLAEICQAPCPPSLDGLSLVPTLRGESQPARSFLYREFDGYGGQQMVRRGDLKAVRMQLKRGPAATELYDLSTDRGEQRDLAEIQPRQLAELEAIMTREAALARDPRDVDTFPKSDK
ncbi:MAG: arylsulfatase [Planctomycetota bacterium]